jgi:hypothetical protein
VRWPAAIGTGVVALLTLVPTLSVTAGGSRSEREAAGSEHRVVGEITSVDAASRTLTVKETLKGGTAKSIAFELTPGAKVMIHGKASTLDEIKPGDSVTVRYVDRNGKRIASSCDVAKPAVKKP